MMLMMTTTMMNDDYDGEEVKRFLPFRNEMITKIVFRF